MRCVTFCFYSKAFNWIRTFAIIIKNLPEGCQMLVGAEIIINAGSRCSVISYTQAIIK